MKSIPFMGDFKIKEFLPRGVQSEIADELKVPRTTVYAVVNGKCFDRTIFKAILKRAIIEKQKADEFKKEAQILIDKLKS